MEDSKSLTSMVITVIVAFIVTGAVLVPIIGGLTDNDGSDEGGGWEDYPYYNVEYRNYTSISNSIHLTLDDLNKMADDVPIDWEKASEAGDDTVGSFNEMFAYLNSYITLYTATQSIIQITPYLYRDSSDALDMVVMIELGGSHPSAYQTGDEGDVVGFDMTVSADMNVSGSISTADDGVIPITGVAEGALISSCYINYFKYFSENDLGSNYITLETATLIQPLVPIPYGLEYTADVLNGYAESGEMGGAQDYDGRWTWNWVGTVNINPETGLQIDGYVVYSTQSPSGEGNVAYLKAGGNDAMATGMYSGYLEEPAEGVSGADYITDFKMSIDEDCQATMILNKPTWTESTTVSAAVSTMIPDYVDLNEISVGDSDNGGDVGDVGTVGTIMGVIPIFVVLAILIYAVQYLRTRPEQY